MVRKYFGTDGIRGKANEGAMTAETALRVGMAQRDTSVSDLCKELGIERVTLYRYVGPKGELRDHGKHVLGLTSQLVSFRKLSHLRASSEN